MFAYGATFLLQDMPSYRMTKLLENAFRNKYGIASFNVFNDVSMEAVMQAAANLCSPVIVGVSTKTAKQLGPKLVKSMFMEISASKKIQVALHLDHCSDIEFIKECITCGFDSVLYDASGLSFEQNVSRTKEVVQFAHSHGVAVEGELEAIEGVEDGYGKDQEGVKMPLSQCIQFIDETKIDSFAPAIGTVHGVYKKAPKIDFNRVQEITSSRPIPIVLHGGTGLSKEVFEKLISLGCCKINISTLLKTTYLETTRKFLENHPEESDPQNMLLACRSELVNAASEMIRIFQSTNQAKLI